MELDFYYCRHCGKIMVLVKDSGMPTICCGEEMKVLEPSVSDGAVEKIVAAYDYCNLHQLWKS